MRRLAALLAVLFLAAPGQAQIWPDTGGVSLLESGADADSTTVQSDSGLELVNGLLTLLRGCGDNEILKWDELGDDDWNCEVDASGGSPAELNDIGDVDVATGLADFQFLIRDQTTDTDWENVLLSGDIASVSVLGVVEITDNSHNHDELVAASTPDIRQIATATCASGFYIDLDSDDTFDPGNDPPEQCVGGSQLFYATRYVSGSDTGGIVEAVAAVAATAEGCGTVQLPWGETTIDFAVTGSPAITVGRCIFLQGYAFAKGTLAKGGSRVTFSNEAGDTGILFNNDLSGMRDVVLRFPSNNDASTIGVRVAHVTAGKNISGFVLERVAIEGGNADLGIGLQLEAVITPLLYEIWSTRWGTAMQVTNRTGTRKTQPITSIGSKYTFSLIGVEFVSSDGLSKVADSGAFYGGVIEGNDIGIQFNDAADILVSGVHFEQVVGCTDLFDTGGPPQTSGSPDGFCDSDGTSFTGTNVLIANDDEGMSYVSIGNNYQGAVAAGRDIVRIEQGNNRFHDISLGDDFAHGVNYSGANSTIKITQRAHVQAGATFTGAFIDDENQQFEGATIDNFETVRVIIDPTADRTTTVPDADTTVPQPFTCSVEFARTLNATTGLVDCQPIVDADVPTTITIDLATLATTLTVTDNEAEVETNAILFTAGGALTGGNLAIESDGDLTYTPNTGNLSATLFGGIAEANLLDLSATETVTGDWNFSNTAATDFGGVVTATGFTSDDQEASATLHNQVTVLDDDSATGDNVCIGVAAGVLAIRDADETATDDWVFCEGPAIYFDIPDTGTDVVAVNEIFVGSAASAGAYVPMSGDASILASGAVTVLDDLHDHVITNIDAFTVAELQTQTSDVTTFYTEDTVVPIVDGGTGQITANLSFNALSPVTTEGDIIFRNATVNARLARGSDGQCLTSNATTITWGSCAAGSGDEITVNGTSTPDAVDLDDADPAAPSEQINVKWQLNTATSPDSVSAYVPILAAADGVGVVASDSGFEPAGAGSDVLALLQGCADTEILKWDNTATDWECQADDTGSALGSDLSSTTNDITTAETGDLLRLAGAGESFDIDFTTGTANEVGFSSATAVNVFDFGTINLKTDQLESDIATGTAPLIIASTTVVPNLNVDSVDGIDLSTITQTELDELATIGATVISAADWTAVAALVGTNTGDEAAASLTVQGIIEIATGAETNTGIDATRAVSPDGLDDWTGSAQIVTVGTIATGVWDGTDLLDGAVSDTLTASLFVGSGSSTTAIDLATAEVAGLLPEDNLAADLVFDAGDLLDLALIDPATALAGLYLPQQAGACVGAVEQGSICWDSTGKDLYVGDGINPIKMNGAAPATEVRSMYWGAGSMSTDGTDCAAPAEVTINSGPKMFTVICTDSATGVMHGSTVMPDSWTAASTVTFDLSYIQTAADTGVMNADVAAQCRNATTTVNSIFGTAIAIDDAAVTGSNAIDQTTSAAVTPDGTCAGGDILFWTVTTAIEGTSAAATLHFVGVKMEYTSDIGD